MPNLDQLKKDVDLFWEHSKHTTTPNIPMILIKKWKNY